MPNSWGRPPRYDMWQDLQALAFWVLIIGVAGFLIFPGFFKDVYSRLTEPTTSVATDAGTSNLNDYSLNLDSTGLTQGSSTLPTLPNYGSSVLNGLYGNTNEISSGYWAIFVADGAFKQLAISSDTYTFLTRLMEKDKNGEYNNSVILAANGQIRKFTVSQEVYSIITNMALIDTRSRTS